MGYLQNFTVKIDGRHRFSIILRKFTGKSLSYFHELRTIVSTYSILREIAAKTIRPSNSATSHCVCVWY